MKPLSSLSSLPLYIPGKPIETLERELGIVGAVKLASNENPLGPSKKGMAALQRGLKEIYRYPDGGATLLREAIAQRWNVQSNQVIVGNGSDEIIALLTRAALLPGDEAILADPSFAIYRLTTLASHGKPVLIPLTQGPSHKRGRHDLARMAKAVTDKTKLIFICNPNNPTGTIVYRNEVTRFLSSLPREICVVFDEAYAEYVTHPEYPASDQLLQSGYPIIFLRTFSKIYGLAGLRIGYGIGSPDRIDLLNRIRQPFNVNLLAQYAARAALLDRAHVEESVKLNEQGKSYLYKQFAIMGIEAYPTEANFICFFLSRSPSETLGKSKQDSLAKEVYEALLQRGVIIRHMGGCCLRVTIGTLSQMKRFIRELSYVLQALRKKP